jgi:hypothetical protein
METRGADRTLPVLADAIWTERRQVEHLLYKLSTARLVLAADQRRHVPRALEEVEHAMELLSSAEVRRDQALAEVATAWNTPEAELTLERLAGDAPEPWASMFGEHTTALRELTEDIERVAADNRRLASSALVGVRTALQATDGGPPGDTDNPLLLVDEAEAVVELQWQEVGYEATLGTLARALPPSLVSFLR